MGISTQQSYRGAQIFESVGLSSAVNNEFFTGTPSRIEGIGLDEIAAEALKRHEHAYPRVKPAQLLDLDVGGAYQWRRKGEAHLMSPEVVAKLQHATQINSKSEFQKFCEAIDKQETNLLSLRGLLTFKKAPQPIPLDEVEPAKEIVKRFATGAMSYGSISKEAHETLAIAMNRMAARATQAKGAKTRPATNRTPTATIG